MNKHVLDFLDDSLSGFMDCPTFGKGGDLTGNWPHQTEILDPMVAILK